MIDFHNHVLPDVDDGSKNMEMTLNMLRAASNQGIEKIINTTHLQHPKMEGKNTDFQYIQNISNKVVDEARSIGINIDIKIASEVYYLPNLCELIDNHTLNPVFPTSSPWVTSVGGTYIFNITDIKSPVLKLFIFLCVYIRFSIFCIK